MKLAILAIGFALGAASVLWAIARSMSTAEERPKAVIFKPKHFKPITTTVVPAWVHDEEALPPFDPHLWREIWERTK